MGRSFKMIYEMLIINMFCHIYQYAGILLIWICLDTVLVRSVWNALCCQWSMCSGNPLSVHRDFQRAISLVKKHWGTCWMWRNCWQHKCDTTVLIGILSQGYEVPFWFWLSWLMMEILYFIFHLFLFHHCKLWYSTFLTNSAIWVEVCVAGIPK